MGSILDPVEGVTLEDWAAANAKMTSGTTQEEICKLLAIDAPKWDRVNAEWLTRMKNDSSFTISTKYAAAFNQSASGNLGKGSASAAESISFEKYIESMVAQDVLDYSNVSSYWSGKMMSDFSLAMKMQTLMNEYKAKYEAMKTDSHSDLEF